MQIKDVLEHLENYAPKELAQSWDNVGLLIGDGARRVRKALICLDATPNALALAIEGGYDLIISHHPLIFKPLYNITNPVILQMIEAKVSLISLHTNFDAALGGVNHALAEELGLDILEDLGDVEKGELGLLCRYHSAISLAELAERVKTRLNTQQLRLWTAGKSKTQELSRIAICGGAGASALSLAERRAEVLITGDISYHVFLDSKIPILDAGHFATEYPALKVLERILLSVGLDCNIMDKALHEWSLYMKS